MGEAILLILLALIFGAGGAVLRSFELSQAFDAAGLPIIGHPMAVSLIVLSLFFAALVAALMLWFGSVRVKLPENLSRRQRPFDCATGILAATILAASGVLRYTDGALALTKLEIALCAAAVIGAAALFVSCIELKRKEDGARYSLMVAVLVMCFYLVVAFKNWGADPVILNYVYRILAIIFTLLAVYLYAGGGFKYRKPALAILFSLFGIYLSCVSLADNITRPDKLFFVFCIVCSVMVALTQTRYLARAKKVIEEKKMMPD